MDVNPPYSRTNVPSARAAQALAARHLSRVGLVVVSGQMEQAVEDEDFDFYGERMALFRGLALGGGDTDGEIAGNFLGAGCTCVGREREHVRGLVFAAKAAVETADCGVGGEQDGDLSAEPDGRLRLREKAAQGAGGGQAWIGGLRWRAFPLHRF